MRTLRIALITQGYQSTGGVQSVARWLVDGLRKNGHEVVVFNLATAWNDVNSRRLGRPRSWRAPSLIVSDAETDVKQVGAVVPEFELSRYLPRSELTRKLRAFDLVQVVAGGSALGLVASRAGRPLIMQVATAVRWERRTALEEARGFRGLGRRSMTRATTHLEGIALRASTAVLVENSRMLDHVRSVAPTTSVLLAPPGVDVGRFTPSEDGWPSQGYLLSVCRLADPRKGLNRLILSYGLLRELMPDAPRLVLAGRNAPPHVLLEQIRHLGLSEFVDIKADVPAAHLASLFQGASVFLQTSHEEGLGISVVEAMACGVPIVATETAGTAESVKPGVTGWLVPQEGDVPKEIAHRTCQVLTGGGRHLAVAARAHAVAHFSTESTLRRFLDTYDKVLADQSDRSIPNGPSTYVASGTSSREARK